MSSPSCFHLWNAVSTSLPRACSLELVRQDQLANDLANATTPGYKADRSSQASFGDVLLQNTANGQQIGSLGPGRADRRDEARPGPGRAHPDGRAARRGACRGRGSSQSRLPRARRTRATANSPSTPRARSRPRPATPCSTHRASRSRSRATPRTCRSRPTARSRAAARRSASSRSSRSTNPAKQGDTLLTGTPGATPAGTSLVQGSLEGSDTNPARVMVDMIVSLRAYESSQKVIHSIDETLSRGIDQGGSVGGG